MIIYSNLTSLYFNLSLHFMPNLQSTVCFKPTALRLSYMNVFWEQLQNTLLLLFRILLAHIFLKNETCAGIN